MSDPWGQPPQQQGGEWSVPQGGEYGSGSFAPPPVDPQYGAQPQYGAPQQPQQPQYGVPQQPQYGGQPQYGAPDPQYGAQPQYGVGDQYGGQPQFGGPMPPGGYGYPVAPQDQKNGFAVAGFVLSITAILGLIFSLLGLSRAGKVGGKGKGLAIAGLVLSIAFGAGWVALGVKAAHSTIFDPGCTSAESSFRSMLGTIEADASKVNSDSGDSTALQADLTTFTADIQQVKDALDSSLAKAEHQSVKDKIQTMDTDVTTVLNGLKAVENGDISQATALDTAASRLAADGDAIDAICS